MTLHLITDSPEAPDLLPVPVTCLVGTCTPTRRDNVAQIFVQNFLIVIRARQYFISIVTVLEEATLARKCTLGSACFSRSGFPRRPLRAWIYWKNIVHRRDVVIAARKAGISLASTGVKFIPPRWREKIFPETLIKSYVC